jgi:hypothetical protein
MEVQNFNVTELSLSEKKEVNGGLISFPNIPRWFKRSLVGIAIGLIIDNWADIKSGAVDGWEDACKEN